MKHYLPLILGLISVSLAQADDGDTFMYGGINYRVISEAAHTAEVAKNSVFVSGDISIEATVVYNDTEYDVISIGESAFPGCNLLKSITIPTSVTSIGDSAFAGCFAMKSITIPTSVTTIGSSAFNACSSLSSVTIPYSVESIGSRAFGNNKGLTEINVETGNKHFSSENGVLYSFDKTRLIQCPGALTELDIPNFVTTIGDYAFEHNNNLTTVSIPESVTVIGQYAFSDCGSLTSVTIPSSVTALPKFLFSWCYNLTSVSLSNTLTTIGLSTFFHCDNLSDLTIPESVTTISDYAFYYCQNLTSVAIPEGVTSIGDHTFYNCTGLTAVDIPESVTTISDYAFYHCTGLTTVDLPESVTSIGQKAFASCTGLTTFTIPNSVTEISESAFLHCSRLTSVFIPNSVTKINSYAFSGCSLASVNIPDSTTEIGEYAFESCEELKSVILPKSVISIGDGAFNNCQNLKKIIDLNPTPQSLGKYVFDEVDAVVYVPKGSKTAYMAAEGWNQFSDIREIDAVILLNATTLKLTEGESTEIAATVVTDEDLTIKAETWSSSDPAIATVDSDGKVTAISDGTAVISYTVTDSNGVSYTESCAVTVSGASAVGSIDAEETPEPVDVYTLQGVAVLRNAPAADVSRLPSGLYIVRQGKTAKKIAVR